MHKMISNIFLTVISLPLALSCDALSEKVWSTPPAIFPEEVKGISVKAGETADLYRMLFPSGGESDISYQTENPDIISVDDDGTVTGIAPGYTAITVTTARNTYRIQAHVRDRIYMQMLDALTKPIAASYSPAYDTLAVARGETATLQLLVFADDGADNPKPELVSFAPEGTEGIIINPEMHWERYVKCSPLWHSWAGGAPSDEIIADTYPDPLMPLDKWDVRIAPGQYVPLWVEFHIPHSAAPGLYRGEMKVSSGTESGTYIFFVRIYNVDLPEKQGLKVVNWMSGNLSAMNDGNGVDMYLRYDLVMNSIIPVIREYGQNSFQLMYANMSACSRWIETDPETEKQKLIFDFNWFEKEIGMFLEACPELQMLHAQPISSGNRSTGEIRLSGLILDGDGKITVDDSNGIPLKGYPVFDEVPREVEMLLGAYFSQLQEYLASHKLPDGRTWLDIYTQSIADEPTDIIAPAWNAIAGCIKKYAPGIKFMEPIETDKIEPDLLDYPCPTLGAIAGNPARGNQIQYMYTCMQPQGDYANRFIRMPLIKTRITHWVNYRYDAVGYLHWGLTYWDGADNRPYDDAAGVYPGGDMYIVYPGYREIYPSIRLSAMRDGINDYDLLKMVEEISPDMADEFCGRVVQNNATYNTDVASFRQLRKEILEYLESH